MFLELTTNSIQQANDIKSKIASGEYKLFNKTGRSKIWNLYAGILDASGTAIENVVYCTKCNNIFKCNKNSSSNLLKHKCYILYVTKDQYEDKVEVSAQTKKRCVTAVTEWAVENCRSIPIVEDSGLKKFASFLISVGADYGKCVNLETLLPQPTTLSKNVGLLYEKYCNEIKLEVGEIKNVGYAITTAMWTDNYLKTSYLLVTIHYVKDGELKNKFLALRSMEGVNLTGENIRLEVAQTLADFNCDLNDKAGIVTDIGVYLISAFQSCNHICCINHLLNNAVESAIKGTPEIAEFCGLCTQLVKYLKKTGINSDLQKTLKNFSPTPWNSIFYLLSLIAKNWLDINLILRQNNEIHRIGNMKLKSIEAVLKVLSSFEESTKMLECENYATLHWVYINIHRLKKICDNKQNDVAVVKAFKEKLCFYLNEIVIKNINIYHKIAIFLFPPTNKLKQFNESEKTLIKKECKNLMRSYAESIKIKNDKPPSNLNISSFNSELLSDFVEGSASSNSESKVEYEIRVYENIDVEFYDDFNILHWWNSHKSEFPLLYKVTCRLLANPASSAASERTSSMAKNLISEKRSAIATDLDTVNQMLFLHCNVNKSIICTEVENICN